jgi:ATP-dependent DNA helicase RecG
MPTSTPPSAPAATKASPALQALRSMGLRRDIDLALHLPLRYEDETQLTPLGLAQDGTMVQFEATVISCDIQYKPRRQLIAKVQDGQEMAQLRFFNFFPSLQKTLTVGQRVRLRGEVKTSLMGATFIHPTVKPAGAPLPDTLTPVYPTVAALPQAYLRRAITSALSRADTSNTLPEQALPAGAWPLAKALQFLHQPPSGLLPATLEDPDHPAWQRLKAEELLAQQLSQWQARMEREHRRAPVLRGQTGATALQEGLLGRLPFALTGAQSRVVQEIGSDLQLAMPMHRLLQGDVGSGKTVVAAMAAAQCMDAGYQCALMAPTEILARQHFQKLVDWLEPLGIVVAWLTGSQKTKEKRTMLARIGAGLVGGGYPRRHCRQSGVAPFGLGDH